MGAHPKNKITRVEQGKRRSGNTPKLKKDAKHGKVPLHKATLAERFAKAVAGASVKPEKKKAVKTAKAVKPAAEKKSAAPVEKKAAEKAAPAKKAPAKKTAAKKPAAKKAAK